MVQHTLFQGYSTPKFGRVITPFNNISDWTLFPGNSSYSFHSIGLKHGGQLDYEVMQRI